MTSALALTSIFAGIPVAVWTALLASLTTLFGVIVADWRNTSRQIKQHRFEAEQKKLDRTMALRQELYVPMADILSDAAAYFLRMPHLKFEGRDLVEDENVTGPLSKLHSATAKLAIIAEAPTAVLAQKLTAKFSETHSILLEAAQPLKTAMMEANVARISKADIEALFERITEALELHMASGKPKDNSWNEMVAQQEKYLNAFEASSTRHLEMLKKEAREKVEYLCRVRDKLGALQALNLELLIAMREEITGTNDGQVLAAEFRRELQLAESAAAKLFETMGVRVKEDEPR